MPPTGVVWTFAAQPDGTVAYIVTALALLAKPVILELQHGRKGERIVGASHVNVARPDTRIWPKDLAGVAAGDGRDRTVLVVHIQTRLVAATDDAADQHQGMAAIARAGGAGNDDGVAIICLNAAIHKMQRLTNDPARQHVGDRYSLLV